MGPPDRTTPQRRRPALSGVAWGALAALTVGANSVVIAVAARRIGVIRTTAVSVLFGMCLLVAYMLAAGLHLDLKEHELGLLALLAIASAVYLLATYRAFALGPLSVVGPITATSGALTAVFAFAFIGQRPDALQWVGICVATAGAVLTSVQSRADGRFALVGPGPLFAGIGVLAVAVSNAGLTIPIRALGPVQAITVMRSISTVVIWIFLAGSLGAASRRRAAGNGNGSAPSPLTARMIPVLALVGFLDAVSFLAFARGLAVSPAWLITTVSQMGRALALVGGIVIFHERLNGNQWAGIALLGAGVCLSVL
jgi:bacterial/archaeal transporter family protein